MAHPSAVVRRAAFPTLAVAAFLCAPSVAYGQAWVPPAGMAAVTFVYQTVENTGHRLADGSMLRGFDSGSRSTLFEFEYAFTDRLSVSAGVPWVAARYMGPEPSLFGAPIDECHCWNHGWQDVNVTARYNVLNGNFALTPSFSFGTPTHSYSTLGEAVLGRSLNEYRIGIDAGQRLDAISRRLSVSGRYSYTMVEQVLDLPNNRSNFGFDAAWIFTHEFSARAGLAWQRSHGGRRSTELLDTEFLEFDRILRDNSMHTGVGVTYSFPTVDLFVGYLAYIGGTDTHAGRALTIGVSMPIQVR